MKSGCKTFLTSPALPSKTGRRFLLDTELILQKVAYRVNDNVIDYGVEFNKGQSVQEQIQSTTIIISKQHHGRGRSNIDVSRGGKSRGYDGKGEAARKSDDITDTLARAKVTPNGKQNRERKQDPPKKSRGDIKKGIKDYFGKGKRVSAPSTEGDPVTTVVQRCKPHGAKSSRAEGSSNNKG